MRSVVAAACVLLLAGCGPVATSPGAGPTGPPTSGSPSSSPSGSGSPTGTPTPGLLVAGRWIPAAGVADVADALRVAGVSVRDGRLLSVVQRRVLDAHVSPGTVRVNGDAAGLTTLVHAGDRVTLVAGEDRVEGVRTVRVAVPLASAAARLYVDVRPGAGVAVEGEVSGERVRLTVTRAPTVGRLRAPATASLTFDDGPSAPWTAAILDEVERHRVPAVFCLVGAEARAHASLVRAEVRAGATLCDHTQTHPRSLPSLSRQRIAAEIDDGFASIVAASGGVEPVYFRAPGGNWSATVESIAVQRDLGLLRWTVDPGDWSRPGVVQIETAVLTQLRPGGVVLLHDGGGDRSQTVAAVRTLLDELTAAGWRFVLPARDTHLASATATSARSPGP